MNDSTNHGDHANDQTSLQHQEYQVLIDRKNWLVTELRKIPDTYHLSRSSFEISDQDISYIAGSISACNMIRSVHAIYDNDDALAECKTPLFTKFNIRLFQAPGNTDNVVVEVRRMRGCSLAFGEDYRAIYRAVKYGKVHPCQYLLQKKIMSTRDMDCMKNRYISLPEGIIEHNLEKLQNNLRSANYDTQMLVLEELALTTNPSSSENASIASRMILQKYTGILDFIIKVIAKMVTHEGYDDDNDHDEYVRSSALTLFGNLLTVLVGSDDNDSGDRYHKTLLAVASTSTALSEKTLVHSLLGDVKKAKKSPWIACQASKCLTILATNSADVRLQVGGNVKYIDILKDATAFGKTSHLYLKEVVDNLKDLCYYVQQVK